MESLRNNEESTDVPLVHISLLQSAVQSQAQNNNPTYAQIRRPAPNSLQVNDSNDQLNFRMQTPGDSQTVTSGRSSVSSGYIDLTNNISKAQLRNYRPTSPETSF